MIDLALSNSILDEENIRSVIREENWERMKQVEYRVEKCHRSNRQGCTV